MNTVVAKLFEALRRVGRPVSVEELLDALWVAPHLPVEPRPPDAAPATTAPPEPGRTPPPAPDGAGVPPAPAAPPRFPVESAGPSTGRHRPGYPIRLPPGAPLLRGREVLRALRGFLQWVSARARWELGEDATVELRCQTRLPLVQLRPQRERALSVCLVIDASASMEVWTDTIRAWVRLITGAGIFRHVRLLRLDADGPEPTIGPWPTRGTGSARLPARRAARPACAAGSVVLVLSDFCSRAWWNGAAFRQFAVWGRSVALGLVGILPEDFWPRTALRQNRILRLIRPAGGGPLQMEALPFFDDGDLLPVASLEFHSLRTLSGLIGHNRRETSGIGVWVALRLDGTPPPSEDASRQEPAPSAEERVQQFLGAASPAAVRLAGLLTLFERLTVQTLQLVRGAAGLHATTVQDAEVLLGGLLHGERAERGGRRAWEYRFHDGVREILQEQTAWNEAEPRRFFERLREYLVRRRHELRGIHAAIPLKAGASDIRALEDQFLDLDAETLAAFGPEITQLAGELQTIRGWAAKTAPAPAIAATPTEGQGPSPDAREPAPAPGRRTRKVWVAGASQELGSYLTAVVAALSARGISALGLQSLTSAPVSFFEALPEMIESVDAVIILVGNVYSPAVRLRGEPARSYTQYVYDIAQRLQKPVYLFLTAEDCAVNHPELVEPPELRELQSRFRDEVRASGQYCGVFSSKDDLISQIFTVVFPDPDEPPVRKPNNLPHLGPRLSFAGWDDELAWLARERDATPGRKPTFIGRVVVVGAIVTGKTRLVVEYARRHQAEYSALLFVAAGSPEALRRNLVGLCAAEVLGLPARAEPLEEDRFAGVLRWLYLNPGWLLILDNASTPEAMHAVTQMLPFLAKGHVVITSRLADWPPQVLTLDLDARHQESIARRASEAADRPRPRGLPIYLSYRMSDFFAEADRLRERLTAHFGPQAVPTRESSGPLDQESRAVVSADVARCGTMLVIIGTRWFWADTGPGRLNDPRDRVRFEIRSGLEKGLVIIPVLINGAAMPRSEELPEEIRDLALRQALTLRSGPDFDRNVQRIIATIEQFTAPGRLPERPPSPDVPPPIYINYRASDSRHMINRLYNDLSRRLGSDNLFIDWERSGNDAEWPRVLQEQVPRCRVMLVIIGREWQSARFESGRRKGYPRLSDPTDPVRREIRAALDDGKVLIPVLIDGAQMPDAEWLDECGLRELHDFPAIPLRTGPEYEGDLEKLLAVLDRYVPAPQVRAPESSPSRSPPEKRLRPLHFLLRGWHGHRCGAPVSGRRYGLLAPSTRRPTVGVGAPDGRGADGRLRRRPFGAPRAGVGAESRPNCRRHRQRCKPRRAPTILIHHRPNGCAPRGHRRRPCQRPLLGSRRRGLGRGPRAAGQGRRRLSGHPANVPPG